MNTSIREKLLNIGAMVAITIALEAPATAITYIAQEKGISKQTIESRIQDSYQKNGAKMMSSAFFLPGREAGYILYNMNHK